MSACTIRAANAGDISSIRTIELEAETASHWPAAEYERIFESATIPRIVLVIESDGQIAGFIVTRCVDQEWELENVAVRSVSRRRGLGRALVGSLLQLAREAPAARIFLEVRELNTAARRLYSQLGFLETGRRPSYYSHPIEDAITYEIVIGI